MAHFRDPLKDKIKDASSIQEDEDCTRVCIVPECNSNLTFYKGPGNSKLCRDHQLKLREYVPAAQFEHEDAPIPAYVPEVEQIIHILNPVVE